MTARCRHALIGVLLARMTTLPDLFVLEIGEVRFPVVWSIIGATLFVVLVGLLQRRPPPWCGGHKGRSTGKVASRGAVEAILPTLKA